MSENATPEKLPLWIIIMGVSGCGKTSVGTTLADELGWQFIEGDSLHPSENIMKMMQGIPLSDRDRAPWLEGLAEMIAYDQGEGEPGVLACSALKDSYRVKLTVSPSVKYVYLKGDYALFEARLKARQGHFMPPELLASQFADLWEPGYALTLDAALPVDELVTAIRQHFGI